MALKGQVAPLLIDHGAALEAPEVAGATTPQVDRVRVTFDQAMIRGVGAPYSVLEASAYTFSVIGGLDITPASTLLVQESPTVVDVLLNEEMTIGAAYTIYVNDVKSIYNTIINPLGNSAPFTGYGTNPQVESASVIDTSTIKVQFDELMIYDSELEKASNYAFIVGPTTLTASSVSAANSGGKTHANVTITGEMRTGSAYTVEVSNVSDTATNPIDTANDTGDFTGEGRAPRVGATATVMGNTTVRIVYDERVSAEAETNAPYSIFSALTTLMVVSVTKVVDEYTYEIVTASQAAGVLYTISIDNTVTDLAGNPIDPAYDEVTFNGAGFSPPEVWMEPDSGTDEVHIRTKIRVTARDIESEHTGIDVSTLDLKVSYETASGATKERVVIKPGDFSYVGGEVVGNYQPGFVGKVTGDPMDQATGVTFHFIPNDYWIPDTQYTVACTAQDNEPIPNQNTLSGTFRTDIPLCFEDDLPERTAVDDALIDGFPAYPNSNKLRQLLMQRGTTSSNKFIQARTLMYLATKTDMRTVLAGLFDYTLVDNIRLCDRESFLSVRQILPRYNKVVLAAIEEIPSLSRTAKDMILQYYRSKSPIYVVNAVALIVLLTAILGEE